MTPKKGNRNEATRNNEKRCDAVASALADQDYRHSAQPRRGVRSNDGFTKGKNFPKQKLARKWNISASRNIEKSYNHCRILRHYCTVHCKMSVRYCYCCYHYLTFLFRRDINSYDIRIFLAVFSRHFTPISSRERG